MHGDLGRPKPASLDRRPARRRPRPTSSTSLARARLDVRTFSSGSTRPSTRCRIGLTASAEPISAWRCADASAPPQVLEGVDAEPDPGGPRGPPRRAVTTSAAVAHRRAQPGGRQHGVAQTHGERARVDDVHRHLGAARREPATPRRSPTPHRRGGRRRPPRRPRDQRLHAGEQRRRRGTRRRHRHPPPQRGGQVGARRRPAPAWRDAADHDLERHHLDAELVDELVREVRGRVGEHPDPTGPGAVGRSAIVRPGRR